MAHDVWLLRRTLVTCLLLSGCAVTAVATNGNLSTEQTPLSSSAKNIPIRDGSFENGPQTEQGINFTHDESNTNRIKVRSENMRLIDFFGRQETKRSIKEGTEETGVSRTRMRTLDKYFVHPEIVKEVPRDKKGPENDGEKYLPALLLEEPSTNGKDFGNRELTEKASNVENYGANSVEGINIVNAASVLENSVESHGASSTKSLKYPEETIGNIPGTFRYYLPTHSMNELQRAKFKQRSRYRYVNSLIRPQLAGISDDLNDLEAQRNRDNSVNLKTLKNDLEALRNRAKTVNLKTLKNVFKSREFESDGQFSDGSAMQTNDGNYDNTKQKTEPRYNTNDMFLLGTPDKSNYFQDVFMANPEPIHLSTGSVHLKSSHRKAMPPIAPWQRYRSKEAIEQDKNPIVAFGKFRGESNNSESGLKGFVHSEDESDSDSSGLDPDARLNADITLNSQTDHKTKAASRVSLHSLKDKAMFHIEEESNDMYNERNEDPDMRYSNSNGVIEAQMESPSLYLSPTKMRDFPKTTTLSSYKRTTIPHRKFSFMYESSALGSGEESGSGEYYGSPHEHHHKQKPTQRVIKVSIATKRKSHAGIFGAQDKATIKKCEKMGKSDYRERCPHGWSKFDEFCYLFVPKSNGKWKEFPSKCNEENGLLAMPKTDKEIKFLQDKISSSKQKTEYFYIGLKKKSEIWTWVDDVAYTRDVHVKDKLGNKNCAALTKRGVHMVTCSEPKAGYICEIRTGVEVLRILAFGDSLTNGFHGDEKIHTPYAETLEYLLNKDIHKCYTLTTIAKDGTEAAEMSTRLQNHLQNAKSKYSWVIILAGTNDISHNSHTRYRSAWDIAVEHIINLHITSHRYGAKTVAVTIPEMDCEESKRPPCLNTHLERKYVNEKIRYYARSNEFTVLCDLAVKFPRYSLSSDERKLMWEVGLHMKPAGYERMAQLIYKDLLPHI